jgi:hypothetical protein
MPVNSPSNIFERSCKGAGTAWKRGSRLVANRYAAQNRLFVGLPIPPVQKLSIGGAVLHATAEQQSTSSTVKKIRKLPADAPGKSSVLSHLQETPYGLHPTICLTAGLVLAEQVQHSLPSRNGVWASPNGNC